MKRWPAEWEKQSGTFLSFPSHAKDWPGKLKSVELAYVDFIKKISRQQMVFLMVQSANEKIRIQKKLYDAHANLDQVEFIIQESNRNWLRDSGSIIVEEDGKSKALLFQFNAWAKYKNFELDQKTAKVMALHLGLAFEEVVYNGKKVVLEGGAIDGNGQGTLITTEECLLDENIQVRNPGFSKSDYESIFHKHFGVTKTIWLKNGICGDDTHGHIDDVCRFISEDCLVLCTELDPKNKNHRILEENKEILQGQKTALGSTLQVIEIPMPENIFQQDVLLPASYANFLFINDQLLVPTFNDPQDYKALGLLAEVTGREVIGIHALDLVWGLGTLHCLSQQIPLLKT